MSTTRRILNTVKQYPELDMLGKKCSYRFHTLLTQIENPLLSRLVASGIPLSSAFSLITKLLSDICRVLETIVDSIVTREVATGNIQTLLVDAAEYARDLLGIVFGIFVAWYSPRLAADTFLTKPADPSATFLDKKEAARLYAMGDLLHQFFIKYHIDYRICCGTALGAKREGGIIRNDDDIDLMIHPDSVKHFTALVNNGTFAKETGICIEVQPWTGGWQSFYADSPKGNVGSPLEHIGKPFVDIFPGVVRKKGKIEVITYGEDRMYNQSKGDYFTREEWGEKPELYDFGPTKLYGIKSMKPYLERSYGPLALNYIALLYPHDVYSHIYADPLHAISILAEQPTPRYLQHAKKAPLDYDKSDYLAKTLKCVDSDSEDLSPQEFKKIAIGVSHTRRQ